MNNSEQHLDHLFATARQQTPEVSFLETKAAFEAAAVGGGLALLVGWIKLLTTKTGIVMLSALSTGIIATVIYVSAPTTVTGEIQTTEPTVEPVPPLELKLNEPLLEPIAEPQAIPPVDTTTEEPDDMQACMVIIEEPIEEAEREELEKEEEFPFAGPKPEPKAYPEVRGSQSQWQPREFPKAPSHHRKAVAVEKKVMFEVTNNTHFNKLVEIKEAAKEAGVYFHFEARINRNYIKRIDLKMFIKENNQHALNRMKAKGNFNCVVGWYVDDNGKATRCFIDDVEDGIAPE